MRKGLERFTVAYSGRYFDGGRIYGQRVVYSSDAEAATKKVQDSFDEEDEEPKEPIRFAGKARKWKPGDKSDSEIYPYWE